MPLHALSTKNKHLSGCFYSNVMSVPKAKSILPFTQQSHPHSQRNGTDTAGHTEAHFLFSRGLSFRSLTIMLAASHTSGAFCTVFITGTGTLCALRAVGLPQGRFCPPGDIWQCVKTFLIVTAWEGGVLLASRGERSEMLLHILQGTQYLPGKNRLAQKVNNAEAERP